MEMEDLDESNKYYYYWHHQQQQADADLLAVGEELSMMSELIEYETAAPPPPPDDGSSSKLRRRESMVNKLISTVYSGPTISDIESALSFTGGSDLNKQSTSPPVVFSPEKVLSKMENKYTLKIKTCGNNGLAEDGYKWRKYGQKSIKNSPNPRSYYRCTNPRCNAKKQVERATDEPDTLLVTYEGLHLHYTYSHFLHEAQAHQQQGLQKKPKKGPPLLDTDDGPSQQQQPLDLSGNGGKSSEHDAAAAAASSSCGRRHHLDVDEEKDDHGSGRDQDEDQQQDLDMSIRGGGLLEDVVPLRVRRPPCNNGSRDDSSSPPSTSSSISCWKTPTSPYIVDMAAILSNIF